MTIISILDGYVDEPTCLGVPPYISTYPRYIAGAIFENMPEAKVQYFTIDQIRQRPELTKKLAESNLIIVIAGMIVPGKYLSGYPIHPKELIKIFTPLLKPIKLLCGSAASFGFGVSGGKKTTEVQDLNTIFDGFITGDPEIIVSKMLQQNMDLTHIDLSETRASAKDIEEFARNGSRIVRQHPYFPHRLIAEIETYRGCFRYIHGGCSFCIEPKKGEPDFRSISDITTEIKALYNEGVRHFRIGNQPCLFSYKAEKEGKQEYPRPNPQALHDLFSTIRQVAPHLKTLHIDNVNPKVIALYPKESINIAKSIIRYHTPGDVAAFGVESVDPVVIEKNNLKANEQEILSAIRLLNTIGKKRGYNGLPELLPGLNFITGLKGETKKTFRHNHHFLESILNNNLLVRRINLRQVIPLPNTIMEKTGNRLVRKHQHLYKHFKYQVKHTIERPLLKRLVPKGIKLTDVFFELWKGKTTFGRQIGSYPLLVGIPGNFPIGSKGDVTIIDHGFRSVTAVPKPIYINSAQRDTIQAIPGVGKKRTIRILANRPFKDSQQFIKTIDDVNIANQILSYISFDQE
jgi:radical SAM superfamily enzyme with C-terminal helix-hairpin-helix motif